MYLLGFLSKGEELVATLLNLIGQMHWIISCVNFPLIIKTSKHSTVAALERIKSKSWGIVIGGRKPQLPVHRHRYIDLYRGYAETSDAGITLHRGVLLCDGLGSLSKLFLKKIFCSKSDRTVRIENHTYGLAIKLWLNSLWYKRPFNLFV